jgi:hypothetical protein
LQYAREPRIGVSLANRQDGQPEHILQISNRAQHRLHHLYTSMRARGKPHNVTIVAVARELSRFLSAAATAPRPTPTYSTPNSSTRLTTPGRRADTAAATRDCPMSTTSAPRSFLDPRTAGSSNTAMG